VCGYVFVVCVSSVYMSECVCVFVMSVCPFVSV